MDSVHKKEGISGLFRGAVARTLWLVPFTVIYLGNLFKALFIYYYHVLMTIKLNIYVYRIV
jgi:hypothetical protein